MEAGYCQIQSHTVWVFKFKGLNFRGLKRLDNFEGLYFRGVYRLIIVLLRCLSKHATRFSKKAISFQYNLVMRGYHIYKEIWEASHGETFNCVRETGNRFDPFAVAVITKNFINDDW